MHTLLKPEEIDLIIKGEHPSPHSVLGNHKVKLDGKDSMVIRTFVPGATTTSVIFDVLLHPCFRASTESHAISTSGR